MKLLTAICGALLLALPAWAGELKGERKVAPFKLIKLESDVKPSVKDGKVTTRYSWKVTATSAAGKLIEVDKYTSDGVFIAVAPPGSTVKVDLTVVDFDARVFDEASAVVEVEGKPEPPPPPPPESALVKALRAAYSLDTDAGKADHLKALSQVYVLAADAVRRNKPLTGQTLWDALKAAATAAGVNGKLANTQRAVAAEMGLLGLKTDDRLDDAGRERVAAAMERVGRALAEVAK